MKKNQDMGWCNCKSDKWQLNRKTPYLQFVRDTYHSVRVDCDGLCFLFANTALFSEPIKKKNKTRVEHVRQFFPDLTVSKDNPEGIFKERQDDSQYNNPSCDRIVYRKNGRAELNKNFNSEIRHERR